MAKDDWGKRYHEPREEAVEKFLDSSSTFDKYSGHGREEDQFYSQIAELVSEGWDFYGSDHYTGSIDTIKWLKKTGYKVKVITKGTRVLIFTKHR